MRGELRARDLVRLRLLLVEDAPLLIRALGTQRRRERARGDELAPRARASIRRERDVVGDAAQLEVAARPEHLEIAAFARLDAELLERRRRRDPPEPLALGLPPPRLRTELRDEDGGAARRAPRVGDGKARGRVALQLADVGVDQRVGERGRAPRPLLRRGDADVARLEKGSPCSPGRSRGCRGPRRRRLGTRRAAPTRGPRATAPPTRTYPRRRRRPTACRCRREGRGSARGRSSSTRRGLRICR